MDDTRYARGRGGQRSGHLIWDRGDVRSQERTQHPPVALKITIVIVFIVFTTIVIVLHPVEHMDVSFG